MLILKCLAAAVGIIAVSCLITGIVLLMLVVKEEKRYDD